MNQLPLGWTETTIGEINLYKSRNIMPSDFSTEEFELYSVPIFPTGKPEYVKGSEIGSSKQEVLHGDILLCKINPRINRVWCVAEKQKKRQIASSEWIVIRNELLSSNYLRYALTREEFREILCSEVSGVGGSLTRAQPKKVATYKIPLAPLPEQIRIANKLDSLLAKVETAQTRLEKIPALLKRFRQAVLAAATSGELTREWREENSSIKDNWNKVIFLTIIDKIRSGSGDKPSDNEEGIRVLRSSAVRDMKIDYSDSRYFDNSVGIKDENTLQEGDLIFTRLSGSPEYVGNCALVRGLQNEVIQYPDRLFCAKVSNTSHLPYLEIFFSSPNFKKHIALNIKSSAGHQRITLEAIKNALVDLPPEKEQREIVRRVESLFAMADTVEKQYRSAKARLDKLTQAILEKAFRGELVPQDPNDEPAAELLKRIQAERTSPKPGSKTHAAN